MIQIAKFLLLTLAELFFESKDEYTFSNPKFNPRKFILFMILVISLILNVILSYGFGRALSKYVGCKNLIGVPAVPAKDVRKNPPTAPSDSEPAKIKDGENGRS